MRHKYIIVNLIGTAELPIIFPEGLNHYHVGKMYNMNRMIVSAGFVDIELSAPEFKSILTVECFGESETLEIQSRPEKDAIIIQAFLGF